MTDPQVSELGQAIQEVTEKVQLLVREEIALAQAEMTLKLQKLLRGIVAGAIAGIFALFGLIYLLHAARGASGSCSAPATARGSAS